MRIIILDDAALWRHGLERLLTESGITCCAAIGDPSQLHAVIEEHDPDIAILDVRLPPTYTHEGIELAHMLKLERPTRGVLLLSQVLDPLRARELIARWSSGIGYLLKDRVLDVHALVDTLATIKSGGTVLDADVVAGLLSSTAAQDALAPLTEREREILALVAAGNTNAAIARALVVSERTVESHVSRVFDKLDLPSGPDAHRRVLAVLTFLNATTE